MKFTVIFEHEIEADGPAHAVALARVRERLQLAGAQEFDVIDEFGNAEVVTAKEADAAYRARA